MKDNLCYIRHIIDEIENIEQFINGYNLNKFKKDKKTLHAIVRSLEIIGEASNKCTKDFLRKYDMVTWREIIDTRNKMIHDYIGVEPEFVWEVCKTDIPSLKKEIIKIFDLENVC